MKFHLLQQATLPIKIQSRQSIQLNKKYIAIDLGYD